MPLTAAQRDHLERRLREERARVQRALGYFARDESAEDEQDRTGDLSKMPFHPADLGTGTNEQEVDAVNATRLSGELAEIDAALERLYRTPERFGKCEDREGDIPFERLDLVPWARTCGDGTAKPRR